MATTDAEVIRRDLLAFIKGQAAYRSGVLPRWALQSTAQLNEWFQMAPVLRKRRAARARNARHRCSHRHTRPSCPARQPFTGHSLLRERANDSQRRSEGSKNGAGYRLR